MPTPDQSLPRASQTREEIARIEVGHTTVSPGVRRALVICFLAAITAVPLVEFAAAVPRPADGVAGGAWSHFVLLPAELQRHLTGAVPGSGGAWGRVVSANRRVLATLAEFERALDDQSLLGRTLRPPAQALITRWLGAGNERVYPGQEGWLFYRQDVEYVTGPGFLDPGQMRRRTAAVDEWTDRPEPDPREALLRFRDDLEALGITLILVPTPVKPGVHPERLARRAGRPSGVLQNSSYAAFIEDLARRQVLIFDPSQALVAARGAGAQYLMTDTHWRPEAMEMVAQRLAEFVAAHVDLPAVVDPGYRVARAEVRNIGDTARMLDLPATRPLFPPEPVWLRRILLVDGSLWRSSREADVLLLGDSFSNIYTLESMGWGTSAGFGEQLSFALRRPLDRIIQNDEAAFATRALLHGEPARLAGKRIVIYQFAVRELAFGDWKVLDLPDPSAPAFQNVDSKPLLASGAAARPKAPHDRSP